MRTTLTCAFTQWSPGLGDNTWVGWLTVVVYLIAGLAAARVAQALPEDLVRARRERLFWWITSALLLALALNKQLDLQTLLTMIARCHAQLSGWYNDRRIMQVAFIEVIAVAGVLALALLALMLRGILGRIWVALLGLGFVCVFVIIRAASFHHVDILLGSSFGGIKLNWLLELPGPTLVALVAHRRRAALQAS